MNLQRLFFLLMGFLSPVALAGTPEPHLLLEPNGAGSLNQEFSEAANNLLQDHYELTGEFLQIQLKNNLSEAQTTTRVSHYKPLTTTDQKKVTIQLGVNDQKITVEYDYRLDPVLISGNLAKRLAFLAVPKLKTQRPQSAVGLLMVEVLYQLHSPLFDTGVITEFIQNWRLENPSASGIARALEYAPFILLLILFLSIGSLCFALGPEVHISAQGIYRFTAFHTLRIWAQMLKETFFPSKKQVGWGESRGNW